MIRRLLSVGVIALAAVVGTALVVMAVVMLGMRARSPVVLNAVRRMNRRVTNPIQMRTAGTPGAYAGFVTHVGRRSGRTYETPVVPFRTDGGFVIVLPYGSQVDWLQNLRAAGRATLRVEGQEYVIDRPDVVPIEDVAADVPGEELRKLAMVRVAFALRVQAREVAAAA